MALTRLVPDRIKDVAARRMMMGGPVDVDSADRALSFDSAQEKVTSAHPKSPDG